MRPIIALLAIAVAGPAAAQEVVTELPEVELKRIPPSYSYDFGAQFGIGDMGWWRTEIGPWMHMGLFGSWGIHYRGNDRFGPGLALQVEGPVPLQTTVALEPTMRWDRVIGKVGVGASLGGAFMYHYSMKPGVNESAVSGSPVAAVRLGWSQGWTRIGRRLFVVAEPKIRFIKGAPSASVALQIGSCYGY
ncbi:MAG: hypothetical protein ACI9MC_001864 [Kiritimatiellia bacterium]|jgi:hypothetical protein